MKSINFVQIYKEDAVSNQLSSINDVIKGLFESEN